eukprot:3075554-Ditylum_brightwellii.AAC.1
MSSNVMEKSTIPMSNIELSVLDFKRHQKNIIVLSSLKAVKVVSKSGKSYTKCSYTKVTLGSNIRYTKKRLSASGDKTVT